MIQSKSRTPAGASPVPEVYDRLGYAFVDALFSPAELREIDAAIDELVERDVEGLVYEDDGRTLRAMHGMHLFSDVFDRLSRDPRLLDTARAVLGGEVYLHQHKLNFKRALAGDLWPWHQDYVFWEREDGLRAPHLVNICVFLDEVHEFNGPLCFIPGSHRHGIAGQRISDAETDEESRWKRNFSRNLAYQVAPEGLGDLIERQGIDAPKGPAGAILLFHPNAVHGSVPNISATDRRLLILTYNRTDNPPAEIPNPRPEFLAGRDFRPLTARRAGERTDTA